MRQNCLPKTKLGVRSTRLSESEKFLLSFEFAADGEELVIHGDPAGFHSLARHIDLLVSHTPAGSMEHSYLRTPAWGGDELSSSGQGSGTAINHVRLVCWKK